MSAEEANVFLDSFIMSAHIVGADNTKDKRWGSSFLALFSGVKTWYLSVCQLYLAGIRSRDKAYNDIYLHVSEE